VLHYPGKASAYLEKGISRDQLYNAALKDFFQKNSWEKPLTLSDKKQAEWLRKFPALNNRQMNATVHLMTKGLLTNALYRKINSVSKPTATRELQDLAGRGVIVSNDVKGAGSKYLIPEQGRG
jgi:predicted HTH transcriptional regulator